MRKGVVLSKLRWPAGLYSMAREGECVLSADFEYNTFVCALV